MKCLIKDRLKNNELPVPEFDKWTSRSGKQIIGIILNFSDMRFHLGVSEIVEENVIQIQS